MLIEGQVITVKHGNVTVKVSSVSLVRVPHICTNECEKQDSSNKNENNGELEEERDGKEEREIDESQKKISTRYKNLKRKLERTEASDKRKKQRIEREELNKDWKEGERFKGIDSVTGEYVSGKIMRKVKGNHENLYNIQSDQSGYQGWFDMNEVKDIEVVVDDIEMVVLYNNNKIAEAKEEEMDNWNANDVFYSVDNEGQKYMSVR